MPRDGARRIYDERMRQMNEERWTPAHDDKHSTGQLARAALAYRQSARHGANAPMPKALWPWDEAWWKPGDPVRMLEKAGALYLAEGDRLNRAGSTEEGQAMAKTAREVAAEIDMILGRA